LNRRLNYIANKKVFFLNSVAKDRKIKRFAINKREFVNCVIVPHKVNLNAENLTFINCSFGCPVKTISENVSFQNCFFNNKVERKISS